MAFRKETHAYQQELPWSGACRGHRCKLGPQKFSVRCRAVEVQYGMRLRALAPTKVELRS